MDNLQEFQEDTGYKIISFEYYDYDIPNFRVELYKNNVYITIKRNINPHISNNVEEILKIIKEIIK